MQSYAKTLHLTLSALTISCISAGSYPLSDSLTVWTFSGKIHDIFPYLNCKMNSQMTVEQANEACQRITDERDIKKVLKVKADVQFMASELSRLVIPAFLNTNMSDQERSVVERFLFDEIKGRCNKASIEKREQTISDAIASYGSKIAKAIYRIDQVLITRYEQLECLQVNGKTTFPHISKCHKNK